MNDIFDPIWAGFSEDFVGDDSNKAFLKTVFYTGASAMLTLQRHIIKTAPSEDVATFVLHAVEDEIEGFLSRTTRPKP